MSDEEFNAGFVSDDSEDEEVQTEEKVFNDKEAMELLLKDMKCKLDWIQHLDISVDLTQLKIPGEEGDEKKLKQSTQPQGKDIQDDFRREMMFYCQAQTAAKEGLNKLRELKIPTERPEDYFAEMVKSDMHMQKIRSKLMDRKSNMEKSEKAKKQRELKKIGKKVQHEVLQKRQQDKKKMLNAVDEIKKGKNKFDKLENDEDIFNVSTGGKENKQRENMKRKRKDDKFGFGGKKRKMKKNSAESASEMNSYKPSIHGKSNNANKFSNKNKAAPRNKRMGKSRRVGGKGKGGKK